MNYEVKLTFDSTEELLAFFADRVEVQETKIQAAPQDSAVKPPEPATIPKTPQTPQAPVAEAAYTLPQLQVCAAELARSGKRQELAQALTDVGINSLMDLQPEQFNAFAVKLRSLGGVL